LAKNPSTKPYSNRALCNFIVRWPSRVSYVLCLVLNKKNILKALVKAKRTVLLTQYQTFGEELHVTYELVTRFLLRFVSAADIKSVKV